LLSSRLVQRAGCCGAAAICRIADRAGSCSAPAAAATPSLPDPSCIPVFPLSHSQSTCHLQDRVELLDKVIAGEEGFMLGQISEAKVKDFKVSAALGSTSRYRASVCYSLASARRACAHAAQPPFFVSFGTTPFAAGRPAHCHRVRASQDLKMGRFWVRHIMRGSDVAAIESGVPELDEKQQAVFDDLGDQWFKTTASKFKGCVIPFLI
jgi:hypothetical protein